MAVPPARRDIIAHLLGELSALRADRPALIAVDGPDAAGKTVLADELAAGISGMRPVIRASIDGFHRPSRERLRQGPLSPDGYYADSFDYDALCRHLLRPLRSGDRRIVAATFDLDADAPVTPAPFVAPPEAVLIFDGVFLLRTELRAYWDLAIYVHISADETLRRARVRDLDRFGSIEEIERRYLARYLPGQAIYREVADAINAADIVLDNTDLAAPRIVKWRT